MPEAKKKNVLVTGGAGFVAPYLYDELIKHDYHVIMTKLASEQGLENYPYQTLDILNKEQIKEILLKYQIAYIVHLAGISSVKFSWENPTLTQKINVEGTRNILEAIRQINPQIRIILVSSGEVYGPSLLTEMPLKEIHPLRPNNPYAISKKVMEEMAKNEYQDLDYIIARPFNHSGPRQAKNFVIMDFASQIAQIEKGKQPPLIDVGNLDAYRDFLDVRDVVKAYRLLLEKGKRSEIYNIASQSPQKIGDILKELLSLSKEQIEIKINQDKFRPLEAKYYYGDCSKLISATGFQPSYAFKDTLNDILSYARK